MSGLRKRIFLAFPRFERFRERYRERFREHPLLECSQANGNRKDRDDDKSDQPGTDKRRKEEGGTRAGGRRTARPERTTHAPGPTAGRSVPRGSGTGPFVFAVPRSASPRRGRGRR